MRVFLLFSIVIFLSACSADNPNVKDADDSDDVSTVDVIIDETDDGSDKVDMVNDESPDTDNIPDNVGDIDANEDDDPEVNDEDSFEPDGYVSSKCGVQSGLFDKAVPLELDPEDIPVDPEMFPLPVQAGSMTEDSAIVSVFTENIVKAGIIVWRDGDEVNDRMLVHEEKIEPRDNGILKVYLEELAPDTDYFYTFTEFDDEGEHLIRSLVGTFHTAFPEGCNAPITISGTHGTNYTKYDEFTAVKKSALHEIDFWVQLGDFTYNDGAISREDFIEKWYTTLSDNGWMTLLPLTGQYLVWDDHEVTDDSTLYWKMVHEKETVENGQGVYFDLIPVPEQSANGTPRKYWNSFKWGDTAEVFTLDVRSERTYEFDGNNERSACTRYISDEQMEWLKTALWASKAHFKIILNSVPIVKMPTVWPMKIDRWDSSPGERSELLDHIVNNQIENVWFLSGDFHTSSVAKISSDGNFPTVREINMGPGGNTFPYPFLGELGEFVIAPKNQFSFFRTYPTVSIVTFDPSDSSVHVDFYDPDDDDLMFSETYY